MCMTGNKSRTHTVSHTLQIVFNKLNAIFCDIQPLAKK